MKEYFFLKQGEKVEPLNAEIRKILSTDLHC